MNFEKGGKDQDSLRDDKLVLIEELKNKAESFLSDERIFVDESNEAKQSFEIIENLIEGFIKAIESGDLSVEELIKEIDILREELKREKEDIVKYVGDPELQRILFSKQMNSYKYLRYKALGFLKD